MEEETAYHEAGHAVMAILLGGYIEAVTIAPEQDDDFRRYGEIKISWPEANISSAEGIKKIILSALAGPVAEMIIIGERRHPGFVPEWKHDWEVAWEAAASLSPDERKRLQLLEKIILNVHERFSVDANWAAIAAVVDHLLAYEHLEDEEVRDIVEAWL